MNVQTRKTSLFTRKRKRFNDLVREEGGGENGQRKGGERKWQLTINLQRHSLSLSVSCAECDVIQTTMSWKN